MVPALYENLLFITTENVKSMHGVKYIYLAMVYYGIVNVICIPCHGILRYCKCNLYTLPWYTTLL